MKLPPVSIIVPVLLYAVSLGLIGYGVWLVGSGDWRGAGLVAPGVLVWVDLFLASKGKAAKPQRKG